MADGQVLEPVAATESMDDLGFLLGVTASPIVAVSEAEVGIEILANIGDNLHLVLGTAQNIVRDSVV